MCAFICNANEFKTELTVAAHIDATNAFNFICFFFLKSEVTHAAVATTIAITWNCDIFVVHVAARNKRCHCIVVAVVRATNQTCILRCAESFWFINGFFSVRSRSRRNHDFFSFVRSSATQVQGNRETPDQTEIHII